MWRPDSGTSPNRKFVLVNLDLWREYHEQRRTIQREWYANFTADTLAPGVAETIRAAYDLLRESARIQAPNYQPDERGIYMITV